MKFQWSGVKDIVPAEFRCGHCGNLVGANVGMNATSSLNAQKTDMFIYICPFCSKPTFKDRDSQVPAPIPGSKLTHLPKETEDLFEEARRSIAASNPTAAILVCRKILAHVSVEKGAKPNDTFVAYVNHLVEKNYLPPDSKEWVDHIRTKGNEANHEIVVMSVADAHELVTLTEMLLRFVYELPGTMRDKIST